MAKSKIVELETVKASELEVGDEIIIDDEVWMLNGYESCSHGDDVNPHNIYYFSGGIKDTEENDCWNPDYSVERIKS